MISWVCWGFTRNLGVTISCMVQAIVPEDYNERQRLQAEFKRPQGYHKYVSLVPLMEKLRILLPLKLTIFFHYSVHQT